MKYRYVIFLLIGALAIWATACSEEGPAEKAGRQFDDAVDKLRDAGDGPVEQVGESIDEAIEDMQDALDEVMENARKASKEAQR